MTQTLQTIHPAAALKGSTNQDVRNKFFNMIGIESKLPPTMPKNSPATASADVVSNGSDAASTEWVNPRGQVALSEESLKYNKADDELFAMKRRKTDLRTSPGGTIRNRKRLGFNETVKVVPIPMRHEYSNRVRSRLWSNAVEIHENAARNSIELAAEG